MPLTGLEKVETPGAEPAPTPANATILAERPAMTILTVEHNLPRELIVLADTGVHVPDDVGYERTILASGWDPYEGRRLAKVDIRIDRTPGNSFAVGSVWTERGWVEVVRPANVLFWHAMPGYDRGGNHASANKTKALATDVFTMLSQISHGSDLH